MKEYLKKVIREKNAEKRALQEQSDKSTDANELRAIGKTLEKLKEEIEEAEQALAGLEEPTEDPGEEAPGAMGEPEQEGRSQRFKAMATYTVENRAGDDRAAMEQRGQALREKRTVTVASSNLLTPKHTSSEITQPFAQLSGLVDNMSITTLPNGETYEKAFVKTVTAAGITEEGATYTTAEPVFDYATINKVKITAYAELTEEAEKLTNADYAGEVFKNVGVALRKKLAEQVLNGTGTKQLVGIFSTSDDNKAIDAAQDLEIEKIDATTLDQIIYAYGGDEEVEGTAALILNKADLMAFAMLRDGNGNRVYDIKHTERTINGIPFYINSNCAALANSATAAGTYCMAYGDPKNYGLTQFGEVEIGKSTDYKFKEGQVAYKASGFFGGNTVKWKGFLRVKKKATATPPAQGEQKESGQEDPQV